MTVSSNTYDSSHLTAAHTDTGSVSQHKETASSKSAIKQAQKHIYLPWLALKRHGIHLEIKFAHQIKEWKNIMDGSGLSGGGEAAPVNKREWEESWKRR